MKKYVALIASLMVISSSAAQAQTFSPATNFTWSGPVLVNKAPSPAFPCVLTVTVSGATGLATAVSFTQFGPTPPGICETINVTNLPLAVSWTASSRAITIVGLDVDTPTPGGCAGNISATVGTNPNPTLTIASSLPGKGGTAACLINSLAPLSLVTPAGGTVN